MRKREKNYIPALGFSRLTGIYDFVLRLALSERTLKEKLVAQARVEPGHRVLDLGCGTATLTVMLKKAYPDASVLGLDVDTSILRIAGRKIAAAELQVDLAAGMADAPPFAPRSFDRIVSSLLFHHLTEEAKRRTLARMRELLRPGGELHVADWGEARSLLMRAAFLGVQLLDGFETTADNIRGRLVSFMKEAGFASVAETHRAPTLFGTLSLYRGLSPG